MNEARRQANLKWDRANMTTLSCRLTKVKAEQFKAACSKLGTNRNAEFLKTVDRIISEAESQGN
jgi:hypothetical protein